MTAAELITAIQMYDFYLFDLHLYLDTHPSDPDALELFKKYNILRYDANKTYTAMFGPLTAANGVYGDRFVWTDEPWPWERSEG